jgi:ubiquinone/menaquinone biosynthesis C-methylase UbiE
MQKKSKYWNNFYKVFLLDKPSLFAKFVVKKLKKKMPLLEVGCGNGRDSFYFLKNNIKCVAYDISKVAISRNSLIAKNVFYLKNFCKKNVILKKNYFQYIYARFFLHTIKKKEQDCFFKNSKKFLKKNGMIFLEFRTIKDDLYNKGKKISKYERITDHYRRFIDPNKLRNEVKKKYNFKIVYFKSSNKFAVYKNDKPHICRLILKKI